MALARLRMSMPIIILMDFAQLDSRRASVKKRDAAREIELFNSRTVNKRELT